MQRLKWMILVGWTAWSVGCKENASVQFAAAGGKKDSIPARAVAAPDMEKTPTTPSSALLDKPVVVESGRFEVKQTGNTVDLPGFQIELPPGWALQTSVPSPRLANLATPEGLVVGIFWFGASGGGVEANLQRWEGQFSQLTSREVSTDTLRKPHVTQARWQGTYAGGIGMDPGRPNEKSVMLAAIVEGAKGSVFFKTVGTISQTNAARGLLRSALKDLVVQP